MSKVKEKVKSNLIVFPGTIKPCSTCKFYYNERNQFPCVVCQRNTKDCYQSMTNGEKLRMMSDEDLAKFIYNNISVPDDGLYLHLEDNIIYNAADVLTWLQSEVE